MGATELQHLGNPKIAWTRTDITTTHQSGNDSQEMLSGALPAQVQELNTHEGIMGDLIEKLVEFKNREMTRNTDADMQRTQRHATMREKIKTAKQYTTGLHVSTGNFALGKVIIVWLKEKKKKEEQEAAAKAQKVHDKDTELSGKVSALRQANKPAHLLTASELKIMVQWYKREGDAAMPSKKGELLARYEETKNRGDRILTPPVAAPAASV